MVNHSPAPWSASEDNAGGGLNIFDARGRRIAHTAEVNSDGPRRLDEVRRISSVEAKANAHLIAKAPAMLALLREFTNWEAYMGGFDGEIWQQARDLIGRVDGVAPEKVEG